MFRRPTGTDDHAALVIHRKRSMTLGVKVWVLRQGQGKGERVKVTDADFTCVAVNDNGRPRSLPRVP
jgi:acyl-CoA thioesterase YciA